MKPLIVITGPTASGKTAMAIETAVRRGCEILNADSMQVYRHMDIGTAKPTAEERAVVPHHLFDIAHPGEPYSVAQYCVAAHAAIAEVHSRGKIPLLVGGTGLYIDSIVNNIQYQEGVASGALREYFGRLADEKGNIHIHDLLFKVDPQSAGRIHVSDRKRVIRALEVYHQTGETITSQQEKSRLAGRIYEVQIYGIETERDTLYSRINIRVDKMFGMGLTDEVQRLLDMGVGKSATAMQAIGYKEILRYLSGEITEDEAKEQIKQGTRRYAKRQMTWFRKNDEIQWVRR